MNKIYCVVYLYYGFYERFRCSAKNAREARKECIQSLGITNKEIKEVYVDE